MILEPTHRGIELLKAVQVPGAFPQMDVDMHTKNKLTSERNLFNLFKLFVLWS